MPEQVEQKAVETVDDIKDLTALFNISQVKKAIARSERAGDIVDNVLGKIQDKLETTPDNFSTQDLLNVAQVVQNIKDKNDVQANGINSPDFKPPITAVQVNIGDSALPDKDSRLRITTAVDSVLKALATQGAIDSQENTIVPLVDADDDRESQGS